MYYNGCFFTKKPSQALSGKNAKKLRCGEHFWKMRSAKCVPDCNESSISHRHRKKVRVSDEPRVQSVEFPIVSDAQTVGRFGATLLLCGFATDAATLLASVTAARKAALDHSATLVLGGIAAGGCKTHCNNCTNGLQKLQKS